MRQLCPACEHDYSVYLEERAAEDALQPEVMPTQAEALMLIFDRIIGNLEAA
jgi:hypothetical protein